MNYSFARHKDCQNNAFYQPQLDVHWKEFPSIISFLFNSYFYTICEDMAIFRLNMRGETAYFENTDIPENLQLILRPS